MEQSILLVLLAQLLRKAFLLHDFLYLLFLTTDIYRQDNIKGTDYAEHSIPFREGETKTAIMRSKMKERHVTGYTLSSKQLVKQISPRKEGQQIVEEVQDYMKQYSILKQTKGIRTEVEENMKQLKETCLKVSGVYIQSF